MAKKETNTDFTIGDLVYVSVRTSPYSSYEELRRVVKTTRTTVTTRNRTDTPESEHIHRKNSNGDYRNIRKATDFELATEKWWRQLRKLKIVTVDHGFDRRLHRDVEEIAICSPGTRRSGLLRVEDIDAAIDELVRVRDLLAERPQLNVPPAIPDEGPEALPVLDPAMLEPRAPDKDGRDG